MMSSWTYHGKGIASKMHHDLDRKGNPRERRYFYVRYSHKGKRYSQQAGTTEDRAHALRCKLSEERRQAKRDNVEWIPPPIRAKQEQADAAQATTAAERLRESLLFENVRERFERRHLKDYAKPRDVELRLDHLGRVFAGCVMNEITRAHVQGYIDDRLGNLGVFEGWTGGIRTAQTEVALLSRLCNFLVDEEEHEIRNPCERAWKCRTGTKKTAYRPEHVPVIPTDEEREYIFAAADRRDDKRLGAFMRVCYYAMARPESEACKLTHDGVKPSKVTEISGERRMGTIAFLDTKTRQPRREIPLHPKLEKTLASVMRDEPTDRGEWAAWAARPIFCRRGGEPWNIGGYRTAWRTLRRDVAKEYPRLAGMWMRDWRSAGVTAMRDGETDSAIAGKIAGHSEAMSDHYTKVTGKAARAAVRKLA